MLEPALLVAAKASAATTAPVLAVISHPVKDYAAWRVVYDSAEPLRQKAGVTGAEVFRDPANPNQLVILHRFPSLDAANGYFGDPALKDAMTRAGVIAAPVITLALAV